MSDYSGWLKALDLSTHQAFAVAACAGAVIGFHHHQISFFAELPTAVVAIVGVIGFYGLFLFISKAAEGGYRFFKAKADRKSREELVTRAQRRVLAHLDTLDPREKRILSYLVSHNQRAFTSDSDGGLAATLMAKGLVDFAARPGTMFSATDAPFVIPDYVWEELSRRKEEFKQTKMDDRAPWRDSSYLC